MPLIKKTKIGVIVAYVQKVDTQDGGESPNVNPAMITQVHDDKTVDLAIFHSNGTYYVRRVPYSCDEKERCTWHHLRLLGNDNG